MADFLENDVRFAEVNINNMPRLFRDLRELNNNINWLKEQIVALDSRITTLETP